MKEEALKLADLMIDVTDCETSEFYRAGQMIRRLVEELDKKQQGLVEASAMLFNYKYELDLKRVMSAHLKEELEKQK